MQNYRYYAKLMQIWQIYDSLACDNFLDDQGSHGPGVFIRKIVQGLIMTILPLFPVYDLPQGEYAMRELSLGDKLRARGIRLNQNRLSPAIIFDITSCILPTTANYFSLLKIKRIIMSTCMCVCILCL